MFGPLAKAIARATNNSIKDDYVQAASEQLERIVRDYEAMEGASPEALFDFEDYVDVASQYIIKKNKADPKDIVEFERLQKSVDPNQYYKKEMSDALRNMRSMFHIIDIEEKSTEALPESVRPLAKIVGDLTILDQAQDSAPLIKSEAKERIGSSVLKDVLREDEYKEIIQNTDILKNENFIEKKMSRIIYNSLKENNNLEINTENTKYINKFIRKEYINEFHASQT